MIISHKLQAFSLIVDTQTYCPVTYGLRDHCGHTYPQHCEDCWKQAIDEIESFEVKIYLKSDTYTVEVDEQDYNEITFDSQNKGETYGSW